MRSRGRAFACTMITVAMGAVALACLGRASGSDAVPGQGPGWTGITHPKDVITARQELMEHIELLMEPIDTIQVKPVRDPERLHAQAETISAMLLAVPHLFPPTTNRFDPKAQLPQTRALPTIWKNFDDFYALAHAASRAAEAMAQATGDARLRQASLQLRASCDACHALYLRPYHPPQVLPSDYQFDFDGALGRK